MANPYFDTLIDEGFKPQRLLQPTEKELQPVKKEAYAEVYKSDLLPKIAEYSKKTRLAQHNRRQKQTQEHYSERLIYKVAFEALKKLEINFNGKKHNAMELFFSHCVYEEIIKIGKQKDFNPTRALVTEWMEEALIGVIAEFESILSLKDPIEKDNSVEEELQE